MIRRIDASARGRVRYYSIKGDAYNELANMGKEDAMSARLAQLDEDAISLGRKTIEEQADVDKADALMRMRFDTNRLTYSGSSYTPIHQPSTGANFAKMDRKTGERLKMAKARESVSIHRSKREFEKSKLAIEDAQRPMPNSLEGLQSLAEERIDEARRNGAFKNLEGKGKVLQFDELKTPMVDRTEFFLNQIIKKQGALPPFVDAQASLDRSIVAFRYSVRIQWIDFCCKLIGFSGGSLEHQVARAKAYGDAEAKGMDRLRDPNWEKREMAFITAQVNDLNKTARGYNIIAPFSARKGYLRVSDELESCYREATPMVAQALIDRANAPKLKDTKAYKLSYQHTPLMDHLFGKAKLKSKFYENDHGGYGFSEWFRDTFRKKEPQKTLY